MMSQVRSVSKYSNKSTGEGGVCVCVARWQKGCEEREVMVTVVVEAAWLAAGRAQSKAASESVLSGPVSREGVPVHRSTEPSVSAARDPRTRLSVLTLR